MKLHAFLSAVAASTVLGFAAGLVLDVAVLGLFALAASVLVALVAATDYGSRPHYVGRLVAAPRRRESRPLAA